MDRYVGKHLVDMLTDSLHLITTWLAHLGEHWSAEGMLRIQTLPGPTLRIRSQLPFFKIYFFKFMLKSQTTKLYSWPSSYCDLQNLNLPCIS